MLTRRLRRTADLPRRRRTRRRRGAEIVELAFALPVMTVIVFGTLELCELMFLRQSLSVASYEAARIVARPDGDAAAAEARFAQIMASRRVTGATIAITPSNLNGIARGETIRVDVTAPVSGNNSTNLVLKSLPDATETAVVVRE